MQIKDILLNRRKIKYKITWMMKRALGVRFTKQFGGKTAPKVCKKVTNLGGKFRPQTFCETHPCYLIGDIAALQSTLQSNIRKNMPHSFKSASVTPLWKRKKKRKKEKRKRKTSQQSTVPI